jgi:hypothetical protein
MNWTIYSQTSAGIDVLGSVLACDAIEALEIARALLDPPRGCLAALKEGRDLPSAYDRYIECAPNINRKEAKIRFKRRMRSLYRRSTKRKKQQCLISK